MSDKHDIEIKCIETGCDSVRTFTVKDQEFFAEKGYTAPKRCKPHAQQARRAHTSREDESQQEKRDSWQGENKGSYR